MIATVAAVLGAWTAAAIPAACLIGRRLRHLEDQTMPDHDDLSEDARNLLAGFSETDLAEIAADAQRTINSVSSRLAAVEAERDGAYRERAHLLAWLATHYPAVIAPAPDVEEPGWQLLYLTAPTGQLSWHIAPRDASLFAHVAYVTTTHPRAQWDGHTTEEKYERIRRLPARAETERDSVKRVGPTIPISAERYADEQPVAALAKYVNERPTAWPEIYPTMRTILDTVIKAQRAARRPTLDVPSLVRVRRDLGQLDRGTFQACTRSPAAWSSFAAFRLVREVIIATPLGHPAASAILRLAADLADQNTAAREALHARTTTED